MKGDPKAMSRALNDFVREFPSTGASSGKARGSLKLTKYVHLEGATLHHKTQEKLMKWDCANDKVLQHFTCFF